MTHRAPALADEILHTDLYRMIFAHSPDGILITDQAGNLLDFNENAHHPLGYSRDEFARLDLSGLHAAADPAEVELHRRQVSDTGRCEFVIRQRARNGAEREVRVTIQKFLPGGQPLLVTTWHEISGCAPPHAPQPESIRQLSAEIAKAEAIFDAIGEGITIRDREFRLIYQNRVSIANVGNHHGEFCYQALHGLEQVCENCQVALSFADGGIHKSEVSTVTSQGRLYFEATASPIRDSAGNIVAALELVCNITAKKQAEQARQEEHIRMMALLNAMPDMVIFKDVEGRHLVVNREAERIVGLTRQKFLGKVIEEIAPPAVAAHCRASDEQAMQAREPLHFEEAMADPAGETIFLDIIKAAIHDEHGTLSGVVMVGRDITARKQAEEKVKASEKRLRDITANLGVGLFVTDTQGKIVFMNPLAEQLLGWSPADLRAKGVHDLIHLRLPDDSPLPPQECEVLRVIASGQTYTSAEEIFVRKNGDLFPVSLICTPLLEDGTVVASVTAFRDISAEKKLETELLKVQKLESVGILAGGIAHDFNNILQAILGSISLAGFHLAENHLEKVPPLLHRAIEATEAAKELSFRLLTFAKGGSPIRTSTSLEEIVRKSVSLSLCGSSIGCAVNLPPDLPPILVDGGQMMQVFNNIFINAKEAMPQGGTITIDANRVSITEGFTLPLQEGSYLCISIRDTGCGIPKKNLAKIFDPYFSMKGKGSKNGSGLGLSICIAIVRKHGGHISVESEFGQGTTFHIHLPVSPEPLPTRNIKKESPSAPIAKRILFMDDDDRVIDLVGQMLSALGCEVEYARHGEEAITLYQEARNDGRPFAGVVLDLTVKGGMGGEMTVGELRKIDPQVKAVIASGYADNPVVKNFNKYGFMGALAKPFNIDQLRGLLVKF